MNVATIGRVEYRTRHEYNQRIRRQTLRNVERFRGAPWEVIEGRIRELEREWDIERGLDANAAGLALAGLALGLVADRRFFMLPAIAAGLLLQHALRGWCPAVPLLRRLGFRSEREIEDERHALLELLAAAPRR
jgi:hypothetical protein